ncbi:hypothetical protein [Saccharopolyspora sp. 5N708]|uniref:hypothetical protein n=1 Tax=Saccharopolyspora sp. 5N708 TaxID=3457424 RepID=UPI003FD16FE4
MRSPTARNETELIPAPETNHTRAGSLFVEAHGGKAVIRHRDDQDEQQVRLFAAVQNAPGNAVVLASTTAGRDPGFRAALRDACEVALSSVPKSHRLWVAVPGLARTDPKGNSPAQKLAKEFAVHVLAPDGPLTLTADGTIFAGDDHHSWQLFAPKDQKRRYGARYPLPHWEALMPRGAVTASDLRAEPIPAGILVHADAPGEDWIGIGAGLPVSPQHPRVLLGRPGDVPISPRRLAALLSRFPTAFRSNLQLVPTDPEAASTGWMKRLAELLGHDVFAATGYLHHEELGVESAVLYDEFGRRSWQPFPVALRYSASGQTRVVAAAPAPLGWFRSAPLEYREVEATGAAPAPDEITARVVPAGLALTTAGESGAADQLAFEPDRMTVVIGSPVTPLAGGTPRALHRLITGLHPEHRGRLRLLVLGAAHERMREAIRSAVGELADRVEFTTSVPAADRAGDALADSEPPSEDQPADQPAVVAPAPGDNGQPASDRPAGNNTAPLENRGSPTNHDLPVAHGNADQATENHTSEQDPPAREQDTWHVVAPPLPPRPVTVSSPPESLLTEPAPGTSRREQHSDAAARSTGGEDPRTPESESAHPPEPVDLPDPVAEAAPAAAKSGLLPAAPRERRFAPDHRSTAAERAGLVQLAGAEFDAALPTVNAALANYPALRAGVNQDEKADFVAICLYVGDGEFGAPAVNRMLRTDESGTDDYVACLTSGLRRLPVHRGPAYGMVLLPAGESPTDAYETGGVLAEPGFVSASAASDLTTTEAHADVVIWSHSARRTAAFGRNGLPDEVVFPAGSRFKVLAVEQPDAAEAADDASMPAAVLMRELRPGEASNPGTLHDTDLTILPRLQRALGRRHSAPQRVIDAPEQLRRIGTPVGLAMAAAQTYPPQEGQQ